jgi:hypothetical protein
LVLFCEFNIAIIAGLFSIFFGKLAPRGWAAMLTILAVVFYTLLVGQQSSSPAWLNLAEHGWAALSSDGEKMWLQVQR